MLVGAALIPIINAVWAITRDESPYYIFLSTLGVLVAVVYLATQGLPRLLRLRRMSLEGAELIDEIETWLRPLKGVSRKTIPPTQGHVAMLELESKYDPVTKKGKDFICWFGVVDAEGRKSTINVSSGISIERAAFEKVYEDEDMVNLISYELGLEVGRYGAFYYAPGFQKQDDGSESFTMQFWEVLRVDEGFGPSAVLEKFESIARIHTLVWLVIGRNYLGTPVRVRPTPPRLIAGTEEPSR